MPDVSSEPVFTTKPSVIGHRGLGKGVVAGHRENTIASLLAAVEAGVDWVEFDVTRTADDELVVHHNPSTTDGRFIIDQTTAEVVPAGIHRLEEVLEALPARARLVIDVKTILEDASAPMSAGTAASLARFLARETARRPVLVTSFDASALLWLGEQVAGLRCGLISWLDFPLRMALPAAAHLGMSVVCVHERSFGANPIEPGLVHRDAADSIGIAHDAGLEVVAWCPDEQVAPSLVAAGVDAVCVNDVPRMLPLVRSL